MIHRVLGRPVPVELTNDPRIIGRVKRLSAVSVVMLGLIWALSVSTLGAPFWVDALLFAGWILMPTILLASLSVQAARYWLVLPSMLVSLGLASVIVGWLPSQPIAASGWLLITAGVALGGVLGLWLWFRVLPVPDGLDDPVSPGRWALIGLHVTLVVSGVLLVIGGSIVT
jgi:hypothetical protein